MLINDLKLQNNNIVKIKDELEISNRIDLLYQSMPVQYSAL